MLFYFSKLKNTDLPTPLGGNLFKRLFFSVTIPLFKSTFSLIRNITRLSKFRNMLK
jgi:hypothetical protein